MGSILPMSNGDDWKELAASIRSQRSRAEFSVWADLALRLTVWGGKLTGFVGEKKPASRRRLDHPALVAVRSLRGLWRSSLPTPILTSL